MKSNKKYPRKFHAGISLGSTSDDRFMPDGYLEYFMDKPIILTEKLDGQNNCLSKDGVFARSHALPSELAWDKPLIDKWLTLKDDIDDYEIFGESMYAVHSIEYKKLESYFYVFAVRVKDIWLSWNDVKEVAEYFGFPTVPEIDIKVKLNEISANSENERLQEFFKANLGMGVNEYTNSSGALGGFCPITKDEVSEGFVIRLSDSFLVDEELISHKSKGFKSSFKIVRKGHVKTDTHWTKNWRKAKLLNYSKYGWDSYSYLGNYEKKE